MKVLLLGGSGFIGSRLAARLADAGHQVTVFARGLSGTVIEAPDPRVARIIGDINDVDAIAHALPGCEVVVHLIGSTVPSRSVSHPTEEFAKVLLPGVRVLDACVGSSVQKIVFLSSGGTVYGVPTATPVPESHTLSPTNAYGLSKLTFEHFLSIYRYHHGLEYNVLRLSNPYGSGQRPGFGQGVIATWMHRILAGESLEIWGDGNVVRDYLCVDDAVSAIKLSVESTPSSRVFNVGSGVGHSLSEVLGILEAVTGRSLDVAYKPQRKLDVPCNILDIALIQKELGWVPTTSLDEGMSNMWRELQR